MTVGEVEHAGQLQTLLFVDVDAEEELSLQLSDLVFGIRAALFAGALATGATGLVLSVAGRRLGAAAALGSSDRKSVV